MACPRVGDQIKSLYLNVAASKNKTAGAIMQNSRLQSGSPQTNVLHHCDWSDSLWCSQTPHVISQVVLLTASLCSFKIKIFFGFTPEKADVSVGYIELLRVWVSEWDTERGCTVCTLSHLSRKSSLVRKEHKTVERKLLVHRCSAGVSTSFLPFNCGSKYWEEDTTDSQLLTSVIIYWQTTTNYDLENKGDLV